MSVALVEALVQRAAFAGVEKAIADAAFRRTMGNVFKHELSATVKGVRGGKLVVDLETIKVNREALISQSMRDVVKSGGTKKPYQAVRDVLDPHVTRDAGGRTIVGKDARELAKVEQNYNKFLDQVQNKLPNMTKKQADSFMRNKLKLKYNKKLDVFVDDLDKPMPVDDVVAEFKGRQPLNMSKITAHKPAQAAQDILQGILKGVAGANGKLVASYEKSLASIAGNVDSKLIEQIMAAVRQCNHAQLTAVTVKGTRKIGGQGKGHNRTWKLCEFLDSKESFVVVNSLTKLINALNTTLHVKYQKHSKDPIQVGDYMEGKTFNPRGAGVSPYLTAEEEASGLFPSDPYA